jgi:oligopeptide/dipeptide ABC transporter ATP-binding protein
MSVLQLEDIEVYYEGHRGGERARAVAGVSLELARGQVIGLAGESGCGKSTLARVAVGLQEPTAGTVLFEGQPVRPIGRGTRPRDQTRLQMVFQDPYSSLNPRRRVGAQVEDAAVVGGVPPRERKARVASLLQKVGLPEDAASRYPRDFSGGQRQRIALARALAASPTALVLDEPFASLDASSRADVLELLNELRDVERIAILLISHDLGVIRQTVDVVAIMYLGRIVETAPTEQLWDAPQHPYSEALIRATPAVTGDTGRLPETLPGEVPDPANPPPGCPFHPRCPYAFDRCYTDPPPLAQVAPDRRAACWLPIERAAGHDRVGAERVS